MGFPSQEHWCGLPFTSPGDLPYSGIELTSPTLADGIFTTKPWFGKKKKGMVNIQHGYDTSPAHAHSWQTLLVNYCTTS